MDYWNQFTWSTKAILVVLVGMVLILLALTLVRVSNIFISSPFSKASESGVIIPTPPKGAPSIAAYNTTDIMGKPGFGNEIIGQLHIDQKAQVFGITPDRQWVMINVIELKSQPGWISAASVEGQNLQNVPVIETGTDTSSEITVPQDLPLVTANSDVQILSGPGASYDAVGMLLAGESSAVIGYSSDNKYWAIEVPYIEGGRGWVNADAVTPQNTFNAPAVAQATGAPQIETADGNVPTIRAVANVNIRSGPDLEYGKIGLLRAGDTAKVLGVSPNRMWWVIEVPFAGAGEAWVSNDYVVAENIFDAPVIEPVPIGGDMVIPTPVPGNPTLTANTRVNIRRGPGIEFEVLGRLEDGQTAAIMAITSDGQWWAINVPSAENGVGWVTSTYVSAVNAEGVEVFN